jgi:hypothetical protein
MDQSDFNEAINDIDDLISEYQTYQEVPTFNDKTEDYY